MKKGEKNPNEKRIDRKHRLPLRIDEAIHNEMDALAFKHNLSLNIVYCEAAKWALSKDAFHDYMQEKFPRDTRRGHYVFFSDSNAKQVGRDVT